MHKAVRELLTQAVAGQRQLLPVGKLGYMLRSSHNTEVIVQSFRGVAHLKASLKASLKAQWRSDDGTPFWMTHMRTLKGPEPLAGTGHSFKHSVSA